jgi:hypothetical protein
MMAAAAGGSRSKFGSGQRGAAIVLGSLSRRADRGA